jgi:hypothetical protein
MYSCWVFTNCGTQSIHSDHLVLEGLIVLTVTGVVLLLIERCTFGLNKSVVIITAHLPLNLAVANQDQQTNHITGHVNVIPLCISLDACLHRWITLPKHYGKDLHHNASTLFNTPGVDLAFFSPDIKEFGKVYCIWIHGIHWRIKRLESKVDHGSEELSCPSDGRRDIFGDLSGGLCEGASRIGVDVINIAFQLFIFAFESGRIAPVPVVPLIMLTAAEVLWLFMLSCLSSWWIHSTGVI